MNNMRVTREEAARFKDTDELCDIIDAIGERCVVPNKISVTERAVICRGNYKTKNKDEITNITFQELGYRDLSTHMKKDDAVYNEVHMVALAIYDVYKKEGAEQGANYSFGFPVAEDIAGFPSKDGKEWTLIFRKEEREGEKSWITYCILSLFLGGLGINNFYAGQKKKGILKIMLTCTLVGGAFSGAWSIYEAYEAYSNKKIPD